MTDLTPTQGRYLSYIHAYIDAFGLPPAESEIAQAIGVSPPSVNQMMKTLERKSFIRRDPGVPRSIEILMPLETIPKWKGKRVSRTVKVWTLDEPTSRKAGQAYGRKAVVYRFKVTLKDSAPPIWRRIETKDATLEKLHELIQTAMGWMNCHLHQFQIAGRYYTDARFVDDAFDDFGAEDYSGLKISDLVQERGTKLKLLYEYDFGDCWQHDVVLESVVDVESRARYPRCVAGERACPPEDVGGVWGFANYLEAITDPDHEEHEDLLEWNGRFDPEAFDAKEATRNMQKGLPAW